MSSLRGGDAIRRAAGRLRETLTAPGLGQAMAAYFDPAEGFAGMSFCTLGHNPPGAVTADDLLAVSLLDIAWRPEAVRQLLGPQAAQVAGLLGAIPAGVDLWAASDAELATVDPLWDALLEMPGVGTATASKLLARKRPRLCPATDKVVIRAAALPGQTWEVLRCLLRDPEARDAIEMLRPPEAAGATVLRLLDVAIWITHSPAREAQRARLAGRGRAA
ncbi:MAG TPA: DUF6308 family protein [Streptosporangiaceae bacterium]